MPKHTNKSLFAAVKIGLMAAGKNVSDFADKTLKLISPRLMPVIADEEKAEGNQVSISRCLALSVVVRRWLEET